MSKHKSMDSFDFRNIKNHELYPHTQVKNLEDQLCRQNNESKQMYLKNQETFIYYNKTLSEMREQIIMLQVANQTLKLTNEFLEYKLSTANNMENSIIKNSNL